MARCSALRLFGVVGLPSSAANGLNTGLCCGTGAAPGAGTTGLAKGAGGAAWAGEVGRADGRGAWAMAGAVRQGNKPTNARLDPDLRYSTTHHIPSFRPF